MSAILDDGGLVVTEWRETRLGVRSRMITKFAKFIHPELEDCSGAVFYSGRDAFSGIKDIYVLGLNPGGDPSKRLDDTIGKHTDKVRSEKPDRWSEYSCERWGDKERGQARIQRSVIHLLKKLGYDPCDIPASNVVFTRTVSAKELNKDKRKRDRLSNACWRFHRKVISHIEPKLILCMGRDAQEILQEKTNANEEIESLAKKYKGQYTVQVFRNQRGCRLAYVWHPSRIGWTDENRDPSGVVRQALEGASVRWSSVDVC